MCQIFELKYEQTSILQEKWVNSLLTLELECLSNNDLESRSHKMLINPIKELKLVQSKK